ncbi:acyltransferase family protein [Kitasatospora sp. NPDC092286]|uniref:acyltransferase family protein n=1 Tax=Kitasatospora sp. NPDC092286 TaxID=3364087 RepID=UPI003826B96D
MGWLDALRGIAALAVAAHHFDLLQLIPFGGEIWLHFDLGLYGVFAFFIVSGYIIPASLERRGDIRGFWIGRIFRIYPALILTLVAAHVILPKIYAAVTFDGFNHDKLWLATNGLMLQDMLGVVNGLGVMWTLTYEMLFYFFVSGLYVVGWHRRSVPIAVGAAAVALVLGVSIAPNTLNTSLQAVDNLAVAAVLIVVMGIACMLSGNAMLARTGGMLLAGFGLVLVINNSRAPAYETWMIFATMFAGTVIYRAEQGQIEKVQAWLTVGFVVLAGALVGPMYNEGVYAQATWTSTWMAWTNSFLGAWASFGLFMLLRKRRFPRPLVWLGAVSFSVYLLHTPVKHFLVWQLGWKDYVRELADMPPLERTAWSLGYLAILLVVCWVVYRLVELPFQNLGRKLTKATNRRWPAQPVEAPPAREQAAPQPQPVLVGAGAGGGEPVGGRGPLG